MDKLFFEKWQILVWY